MSPTKICQFTSKGIQLFESAIKSYSEDKDLSKLEASFKDLPNEITEISDSPDFDNGLEFTNRYELSKYLFEKIGGFIEDNQLINEPLMWTWLAYAFFDTLTDDKNSIRAVANYVLQMGAYRNPHGRSYFYRHAIREGFLMYKFYGADSKIYFNHKSPAVMGDFWEQTRSRGFIVRNSRMHGYIKAKYADKKTGFAKPNSCATPDAEKGVGADSLRRFGPMYKRVCVAYAGPMLGPSDLGNLLGPHFCL